ncbi:hypothetical protein [Saccharothrix sp. Mg75]|uniref:hypothetical protein n=1 Tax=Saccharothrix sp. Mg75 TaxID=3445357 RepID=UPI003EEDFAA5
MKDIEVEQKYALPDAPALVDRLTASATTTVRPADRRAALHLDTSPASPRPPRQRVRTHVA